MRDGDQNEMQHSKIEMGKKHTSSDFNEKKISGWWIPSGFVSSIIAQLLGIRSIGYTTEIAYFIGMATVLVALLLLVVFFKRTSGEQIKYDLNSGPPKIRKIIHLQIIVLAFILGWVCGDYFILITKGL